MIEKIVYAELDESVRETSEIYFWQNAIGISPKFIEGFMEYQSKWIEKRRAPLKGNYKAGTMTFGVSVIKNKPVVLADVR